MAVIIDIKQIKCKFYFKNVSCKTIFKDFTKNKIFYLQDNITLLYAEHSNFAYGIHFLLTYVTNCCI